MKCQVGGRGAKGLLHPPGRLGLGPTKARTEAKVLEPNH
mgnify:CR=1 FL=1